MRVVAFVGDLMDRSKISAAVPDAGFASAPEDAAGADVVVIDVKIHPEALEAARTDGADVALPRSRFFQDPAAAVTFSG